MATFQFGLIVAMLFSVQVIGLLALTGLEKVHQEIGEQDAADEKGEGDGVLDETAR